MYFSGSILNGTIYIFPLVYLKEIVYKNFPICSTML